MPRRRTIDRRGLLGKTLGMKRLSLGALCVVLALGACNSAEVDGTDEGRSDVAASEGQQLFEDSCASCHGQDLNGTSAGPPFLNDIYEPGHHPDESFQAAVANGVQAHHWEFGDMPPVPGLSREEVAEIIAYVRSRQEAAGIE